MNKGEKRSYEGKYARPGCASQQADSGHQAKNSSSNQKDSDDRHEPGRVEKREFVDPPEGTGVVGPMCEGSGENSNRNGPMQQNPKTVRDPENCEGLHMPVHAITLIGRGRIRGDRNTLPATSLAHGLRGIHRLTTSTAIHGLYLPLNILRERTLEGSST